MLEHPPDLSPVFNIDAVSKVPSSCWGPLSCPLRISTLNEQALKKWCPDSESNQGHGDFQSPALPTELSGQRGALNPIRLASSTKFLQIVADCTIYHHFADDARELRQKKWSTGQRAASQAPVQAAYSPPQTS